MARDWRLEVLCSNAGPLSHNLASPMECVYRGIGACRVQPLPAFWISIMCSTAFDYRGPATALLSVRSRDPIEPRVLSPTSALRSIAV
jgi:hypothetical protein